MNVERWAQALKEEYPRGLLGEREALVSLLVGKGLSHAEAVEVALALEAQGYAHFLPGERPRLFFSSRSLDQEFPEFVGEGDEEEEALAFLAARLGDREVAREVLEAMRAAGYVERAYSPELARDRLFFRFPEALRLLG